MKRIEIYILAAIVAIPLGVCALSLLFTGMKSEDKRQIAQQILDNLHRDKIPPPTVAVTPQAPAQPPAQPPPAEKKVLAWIGNPVLRINNDTEICVKEILLGLRDDGTVVWVAPPTQEGQKK